MRAAGRAFAPGGTMNQTGVSLFVHVTHIRHAAAAAAAAAAARS